MNLIGLSHGSSRARKVMCWATVVALAATQGVPLGAGYASAAPSSSKEQPSSGGLITAGADPASGVGPTCGTTRAPVTSQDLPHAQRLGAPTSVDELLTQPVRVRVPGRDGHMGQTDREVSTAGRWLPGYKPNTPEAWQKFEAWKAEQRRARLAGQAAVPTSPTGSIASGSNDPQLGQASDDAPVTILREETYEGSVIDLRDLEDDTDVWVEQREREHLEVADPVTGIPWDEYNRLKENAWYLPETPNAQVAQPNMTDAPTQLGVTFNAINAAGSVPPDPIMTAGPGHLVALVNTTIRMWGKSGGAPLFSQTTGGFFTGVPNCGDPFDVFVDYDEQNDRYVLGGMTLSGSNSFICIAASQTGDPTTLWNRYSFRSDAILTSASGDYPHMGIGLDAVYIGMNMFDDVAGTFDSARLFAVSKANMYAGTAIQVAEFGVAGFRTAQPARIRGFNTGQWPAPGTPHHILTQQVGSGSLRIYRWVNPFTPSNPTLYGTVATTYGGTPPNAPEDGDTVGDPNLNDTSAGPLLDAEYRAGTLWSARTVGCNIGGGNSESCIDWVKIDVSGGAPALLDQQSGGAFGSANEFRYYPDLAVDKNGNMAIGYTKSSFTDWTELWVTGRLAGDPAGTLQVEDQLVAGTGNYTDGAGCGGACDRWGDYSGMAADPDGCTFWYIGEYSNGGAGLWRTQISSYKFDSCSVTSSVGVDKGTYDCTDSMRVTVNDATAITAATASAQTVVAGAGGDSETIPAAKWIGTGCTGTSCTTWNATLPVSGNAGSDNDGTLNISNGESVSIDYTDPHGGHTNQTREAAVSCTPRFEDGGFLIFGGCEAGTGTERYREYIDAGEYVRYIFGVYNPPSGPNLTDVQATLSITGPLAGQVTIYDNSVYIGPMHPDQLSGAEFDVLLSPSAAASGLSANDFHLTLTSVADGYAVPQVLTQPQLLQTDDNIVNESQCFNMESNQGFQTARYVESYVCTAAPCAGQTINSVQAPWTRGIGCLSETRSDYPEMSCDVNGTFAYTPNNSAAACGTFAQAGFTFTSDVLYTPRITPAHTGNAPNGQPWFYNWLFAEWFYDSDMIIGGTDLAIGTIHLWSDNYAGPDVPPTNDIDAYPWFSGGFIAYDNQQWDSGTPWNPNAVPANYDGIDLDGITGQAVSGMRWRWAIWERDADAFSAVSPTTTAATAGAAYDDMNLNYDQYHATAQSTVCSTTTALGNVAFDQFTYTECPGGVLDMSVLDGNGANPVTLTVVSSGTGDSETITISGSSPRWADDLPYSTSGGGDPNDGVLFVTPDDILDASYNDNNPVGEATAFAFVECPEQDVVVQGIAGVTDTQNSGDNDDIPDTNEIVDFSITIRNDGDTALSNVQARIWTSDSDIDCITKDTASFGTIASTGGTATNNLVSDPFTFKVSNSAQCSNPSTPPSARFNVFITADTIDGPATPQFVSFNIDLNSLGTTVVLSQNFNTTQPAGWVHAVGPGDEDGLTGDPGASGVCSPYVDEWFWRNTGGNPTGGFFCWTNTAANFPAGTYSASTAAKLDAVLDSPPIVIPAGGTGASLQFDHEYKFANNSTLRADGAVVYYNVNGGPWNKITTLPYDGPLIFNTYCNPLCNGGADLFDATPPAQQDCFHETVNDGESVFNILPAAAVQNWETVSANITGLASGDNLRIRWRVGSMDSTTFGLNNAGGYGLDNVIVSANQFGCDAAVRPNVGCGVVFKDSGNLTEACGDGDAFIESNEQWEVDVTLQKLGDGSAVNTTANLAVNAGSANTATITGNPQNYGTIPQRGGTATATYQFEVEGSPVCIDDITFDVTNINTTGGPYPNDVAAFDVPVGAVSIGETGNQQTNPARAQNSTASAPFTPAFAQGATVGGATVSYSFGWSGSVIGTQVSNQTTNPFVVQNATLANVFTPAFTIPGGTATSATINWASFAHGSATSCTTIVLRTPNLTNVTLKADGAPVPAVPIDILSTYNGPNGGPGAYQIVVTEDGGGCSGNATLTDATMTVSDTIAGSWTTNARVSLVKGANSTILKNFAQADANPYNVTAFYNAQGPGTYEIRVEENAGGVATVDSAVLGVDTIACTGTCAASSPPPPVGDGLGGTQMMRASRGAGPDDVNITFDTATCSDNHAVVLRGNFGNFTGYQGAVATGCNAGNTGTASFTQSGSYWFNVVWVSAGYVAGYPGTATSGPEPFTAAGFCGVTSDDASDQVCN
jgi:hypothetical protein